ncbi:MAG TPA: hypothetical protein VG267_15575 [Terracidiphilus sp.]|jgi:hypothetical protein|nr:hypothetical protein [Terracidiphilus sp.]
MRERIALALMLTGLFACTTACKKQVDRAGFTSAINKSFDGRHDCVWPEPIKLPAEIDPSKDDRIRSFQALTDAGLLARVSDEKKRLLAGDHPVNILHPVNTYDLSDQGHSSWTPDPNQKGYGNFCFGHFNVTAIDRATPNDPSNPTQYTVTYHYEVEGIPGWATTPESMRAFPRIAADTSIQSATATLVKGANGGWAVVPPETAQ